MALGYARALKAIGSKEQALEVLKTSYQTAPTGEVAAELGRLALDMGRLDIAKATLQVAEAQGVRDWKTLSALGTLRAKQNQHAEAQQYFLAALQLEPNAVSVINNLALSYALDNKVDRAEDLLRNAVREGHEDKRVRQNLALVLGIEGKYDEARKVAQVDLPESDAKANMAYLRNMLTQPTAVASLDTGGRDEVDAVPNGKGGPELAALCRQAAGGKAGGERERRQAQGQASACGGGSPAAGRASAQASGDGGRGSGRAQTGRSAGECGAGPSGTGRDAAAGRIGLEHGAEIGPARPSGRVRQGRQVADRPKPAPRQRRLALGLRQARRRRLSRAQEAHRQPAAAHHPLARGRRGNHQDAKGIGK